MPPPSFVGAAGPLTKTAVDAAIAALGTDAAGLWSLITVETRGCGFLADRRPQILFERHVFHKRTAGRFSAAAPDISNAERGGYLGGAKEYQRLAKAMALDRQAAVESASWGIGQIMGFNAAQLDYAGADDMIQRFCGGEDAQLDGICRFISKYPGLSAAFAAKNWDRVAFYYNGSAYKEKGYHLKLQQYDDFYSTNAPPDLEVRAAQLRLLFAGFDPNGIDGVIGPGTTRAVSAFQRANGLTATGRLDPPTLAALATIA
jgi:hypothetical protein